MTLQFCRCWLQRSPFFCDRYAASLDAVLILVSREDAVMLYVVLFTDNAEHAEMRGRLMPAHLDFLEGEKDRIRAAGPLRDADGSGAGGLWLVEAEGREEVEQLCRKDPFWPSGLRRSIRVLEWAQVFAQGRRLI